MTNVSVDLPEDVVEDVESRLVQTEFNSVDEYITFVLREVLGEVDKHSDGRVFEEREAEIRDRLRTLGYLK